VINAPRRLAHRRICLTWNYCTSRRPKESCHAYRNSTSLKQYAASAAADLDGAENRSPAVDCRRRRHHSEKPDAPGQVTVVVLTAWSRGCGARCPYSVLSYLVGVMSYKRRSTTANWAHTTLPTSWMCRTAARLAKT